MDDDFSAASYLKLKKEKEAKIAAAARSQDKELTEIEKEHAFLEADALRSTETALKQLQDTQQVAQSTLDELAQQGEKLSEAEQKIKQVDANADANYKAAKKVKKHGHFLAFLYGRRAEKKGEIDKAFAEKTSEIESKKLRHQMEQEGTVEGLQTDDIIESPSTGNVSPTERAYRNETDRKIDENLDEINSAVDQLKLMTQQMGTEMDKQQLTMEQIDATREHVDATLGRAAGKIEKYAV